MFYELRRPRPAACRSHSSEFRTRSSTCCTLIDNTLRKKITTTCNNYGKANRSQLQKREELKTVKNTLFILFNMLIDLPVIWESKLSRFRRVKVAFTLSLPCRSYSAINTRSDCIYCREYTLQFISNSLTFSLQYINMKLYF